MSSPIDWEKLANSLGLLQNGSEHGSTTGARQALEILIGEERIRETVDYYIAGKPGSELARNVLWQIRPWSAMQYCYEILGSSRPLEDRQLAVELLRVVADRRVLPWIGEILAHDDPGVQIWGIGVLDQLLWSDLVTPEEGAELLKLGENHKNEAVRVKAAFIREYLAGRQKGDAESSAET